MAYCAIFAYINGSSDNVRLLHTHFDSLSVIWHIKSLCICSYFTLSDFPSSFFVKNKITSLSINKHSIEVTPI